MCKNDQNHNRQLLKPAHLAHKLKSARKKNEFVKYLVKYLVEWAQYSIELNKIKIKYKKSEYPV